MLLSSAKFELSSSGREPVEIDVTKRVGVDLILPVASLLPLERLVQWGEKMEIPRQVLDTVADNADDLAAVLIAAKPVVDKLVLKIPKVGPFLRPALPRSDRGRQDVRPGDQEDQRAGPREPRLPDGDADAVQVGP